MKVGFIGTGSMGQTLVKAFMKAKTFPPSDILLTNRTRVKAEHFAAQNPGIRIFDSNVHLVQESSVFFLCIKPLEFHTVLKVIHPFVRSDQLCISITSPVMLSDLETWIECKVVKIIPSITNQALSGTILYSPGSRLTIAEEEQFRSILSSIGTPLKIDESYTRIASDLSSCGPAFLANLLTQMIDTATEFTGIPKRIVTPLVTEMAIGVANLLVEEKMDLSSLQKHVSVPGGITEQALHLLAEETPTIWKQIFHITHKKYEEDKMQVRNQLRK